MEAELAMVWEWAMKAQQLLSKLQESHDSLQEKNEKLRGLRDFDTPKAQDAKGGTLFLVGHCRGSGSLAI